MRAAAKNLVLFVGAAGIHAGLRFVFRQALPLIETRFSCGCHDYPAWTYWLIKANDLFTYTLSFGNLIVGDLLWGVVALTLYLLVKKWRVLSYRIGPRRNGLVAAWIFGDALFYVGLIIGPVALIAVPGRWLYDWVHDVSLLWPIYVGGLCVIAAVSKALFSGGSLIRARMRLQAAVLKG